MCNNIEITPAYDHPKEIISLFSEYTDMLISEDPTFQQYLDLQNYDKELQHLETKYALPHGRLYLACQNKTPAGCIALRKIDSQNCEMKRLYVRPQFRGNHIGNHLIEKIIQDAKEIGYSHMLLDTLPFLKSAIHLYKTYGFQETQSYNNNPIPQSIYMNLNL